MRNGSTLLGSLVARKGSIGSGGYNTGGAIADDGTLVVRTDTYNGYLYTGSTMLPIIRPGDNITEANVDYDPANSRGFTSDWGRVGAFDVAICATNSSIIYIASLGYVFKTTDKTVTLSKTAFVVNDASVMTPNNSVTRLYGRKMAVDPQNGSVVLIGTDAAVRMTTDGGATWPLISTASLPAPTAGTVAVIAFDRSSAVVSGKTQGIHVFIPGSGLYHTTDGGTTWALVANCPTTTACHITVHPVSGAVFLSGLSTSGGSGQLYYCSSPTTGVWSTITGVVVRSVTVSSRNTNNMFAIESFGVMWKSADGGATWTTLSTGTNYTQADTTIGWLGNSTYKSIASGMLIFDPTQDRCYLMEGRGSWYATLPTTGTNNTIAWTGISAGIEQIVSLGVLFTPNRELLCSGEDRPWFIFPQGQLDSYQSSYFPTGITNISHAQTLDWAIDDPSFLAGVVQNDKGWTRNGGVWSRFAADVTAAAGVTGGNVAVGNKLNMVWIGAGVTRPYYTLDGWATYNLCNVAPNAGMKWINSYSFARCICIADKNHPGTFYLYNHGFTWDGSAEHYDSTVAGVYKSLDGGANFTRICTVQIDGGGSTNVDYYNGKIKQVIEVDGDFLWAAGNNGTGLFRSRNGCASWSELGSFTQVFAYGIGKAKTGTSYPTLLVAGYLAGVYGFYESVDGGTTWVLKFTLANNKYDEVMDIDGDPGQYGRWAIAYGGSGVDLIDYNYKMRLH